MTEPMDRNGPERNVIDGSAVIARETARLFVPASKSPDGLSLTTGIEKCLLEDGREVHQCASMEDRSCNWWHEKGESVRAHLRAHSEKTKFKVQQLKAERDELVAREAQRRENYRKGALKGVASRRANRENGDTDTSGNEPAMLISENVKDRQNKIDNAQTTLEGVSDGLDKIRVVVSNMRNSIDNALATLEELHTALEVPVVDPILVEKAASWDAIQGLLNKR